jgi:hypothetical protein
MDRRRLLLDAADVYPVASAPENRLTEILAEVLRTSPQLLRWLAARAFPATGAEIDIATRCIYGNYKVDTQFSLGNGRERPDIQVWFLSGPAPEKHRFFVENKLDAGPTDAQNRGYQATDESPVIVVHPEDRPQRWLKASDFKAVSWTEVARTAFKLGNEWACEASESWPAYALTPGAPSEYRMLAELCRYLEREVDVTVPRAITADDLEILPRLLDTRRRWDELADIIRASLDSDPGIANRYDRWEGRDLEWSVSLHGSVGWPALHRYWETRDQDEAPPESERGTRPNLTMSLGVPWNPEVEQSPAVGVGIGVHVGGQWPYGLREGQLFYRAAMAEGFRFGTTWKGTVGRVYRTMKLKDLANSDGTLDEQAQEILDWARETLAVLRSLDPVKDASSSAQDGGPASPDIVTPHNA